MNLERTKKIMGVASTVKKLVQTSVSKVIVDQELLFLGVVVGPEADHIGVPELADHVHVLLEVGPRARVRVFEPLHRYGAAIVKHRTVHRPEASFSQHLRRCPQKVFQLEPFLPVEEHQFALIRP